MTKTVFDSDDEWLLNNLTSNAGIILRNAMQFDESVLLQHHFKQLVVEGSKFLTLRTVEDFQIQAERALNKRFDLAESKIYFIDYKKG